MRLARCHVLVEQLKLVQQQRLECHRATHDAADARADVSPIRTGADWHAPKTARVLLLVKRIDAGIINQEVAATSEASQQEQEQSTPAA